MSSTLEVTPTKVNITPGGEVVWHVSDVAGGKLYTPTAHDTGTADPMQLFNYYLNDPLRHETLGEGGEATVRSVAGYAIKHYNDPTNHFYRGDSSVYGLLPDLRANVTLSEGLKAVTQRKDIKYDVRGIAIHAAYMPDDDYVDNTGPFWLMEELPYGGNYANQIDAQTRFKLRRVYDAALTLMNLGDYAVDYDDMGLENAIITKAPTHNDRGTIVKFDSIAVDGWWDF